MYRFHSSMVERPHSIRGGPGSIRRRCSSIFGIWREVLECNVYITSQYFFPAIIYRDIISIITSTFRYIMYFFRTFKKSTASYKVHSMGLWYIKILSMSGDYILSTVGLFILIWSDGTKRKPRRGWLKHIYFNFGRFFLSWFLQFTLSYFAQVHTWETVLDWE